MKSESREQHKPVTVSSGRKSLLLSRDEEFFRRFANFQF